MVVKLYYRKCSECKSGMSAGYMYHEGKEYFCKDDCVGKFFGDRKAFTSLDDWNNDGPGLTWDEFNNHWDNINDLDNNAFEFACEVMSYTEWEEEINSDEVFDKNGKSYTLNDLLSLNEYFEIVMGEG